jgi:hypothetical protein
VNIRIVIWDIHNEVVVKIIDEQSSISYCTGEIGEVLYLLANGVIRYINLRDNDMKDYKIEGFEPNSINQIFYFTSKYLLLSYSYKQNDNMLLYALTSESYINVKQNEGNITLKPLVFNDNEFIYLGDEYLYLSAYNFIEGKDTIPFKIDMDDYYEDSEYDITSYVKYKETDIISTNSAFEIRLWDILTRNCKRVLPPALSCWIVVPLTDSFITVSSDNYLQIFKTKNLTYIQHYLLIILSTTLLSLVRTQLLYYWKKV